jgi:hypothetical protein
MTDLGLRGEEIVELCLEDIDWRAGTLVVRKNKQTKERLLTGWTKPLRGIRQDYLWPLNSFGLHFLATQSRVPDYRGKGGSKCSKPFVNGLGAASIRKLTRRSPVSDLNALEKRQQLVVGAITPPAFYVGRCGLRQRLFFKSKVSIKINLGLSRLTHVPARARLPSDRLLPLRVPWLPCGANMRGNPFLI